MTRFYQGHSRRLAWGQYVLNLGLLIGLGAWGGVAQAAIQFVDQSAGLPSDVESFGASWADIDGDGKPDFYATNHRRQGHFYRNNGNSGSTKFSDVTLQLDSSDAWVPFPWGIDKHAGSFADFDKDGDIDFYSTNSAAGASHTNAYLFRKENGLFVDRASLLNVTSDSTGRHPLWLDYDNNGRLDLAVLALSSSRLFWQQSDGTFTQRQTSDGFTCNGMFMQLADLDGGGWVSPPPPLSPLDRLEIICVAQSGAVYPDRILTTAQVPLTNITTQLNFPVTSPVTDAAIADFDNDGRNEVVILKGKVHVNEALQIGSNRAEAHLHISPPKAEGGFGFASTGSITVTLHAPFIDPNEIRIGLASTATALTFTLDPANPAHQYPQGVTPNRSSQGLYVGFNVITQRWEFWIAAGGADTPAYIEAVGTAGVTLSNVAAASGTLQGADLALAPRFLRNTGSSFVDETFNRQLTTPVKCSSVAAADFDNDMDLDLYLACRGGVQNIPNILYENMGAFFQPVVPLGSGWSGQGAVGQGLGSHTGASDAVVVADYDVDGRMDVALTNGVRLTPLRVGGPNQVLRNTTSNSNNWLELDLVGTFSNRDAIGAKVKVTAGSVSQYRGQNGGYHRWSQNHSRLHFGLAGNLQANTIEVRWPRGFVDTFSNVQANKLYRVTEGNASNSGTISEVNLSVVPLPAPQPGNEYGVPVYHASDHKGVFLYKNLSTQVWSMRVAAGGSTSNVLFAGDLTSDQPFTNVAPFNLETGDVLDNSTATAIQFGFNTSFSNIDGVDFKVAAGATNACLNLPANVTVMVGPDRKTPPINMPINLLNFQQPCSAPPAPPPECGVPAIQATVDRALFLYRDCSVANGKWTVRATSGGNATVLFYEGNVTSAQAFSEVSSFSFEGGEILSNPNPPGTQITYSLNMAGGGTDGFSFRTASEGVADNNCFKVTNLPANAQVLIGPNRQIAPTTFNLNTLMPTGACN